MLYTLNLLLLWEEGFPILGKLTMNSLGPNKHKGKLRDKRGSYLVCSHGSRSHSFVAPVMLPPAPQHRGLFSLPSIGGPWLLSPASSFHLLSSPLLHLHCSLQTPPPAGGSVSLAF